MIINILLILFFFLWLCLYFKSRKFSFSLPYLLTIFLTPFYNILDEYVLLKVFGCGCVPSLESNMLNISLNANDIRLITYILFTIIALFIGVLLSKRIKEKNKKIIYIISIVITNVIVTYIVCHIYRWK